jgi:hypothetical protein
VDCHAGVGFPEGQQRAKNGKNIQLKFLLKHLAIGYVMTEQS